jgi:hypothetical protein
MRTTISHEFVETIPDHLLDGIVYISIPYDIAAHRCCCGCGHEVISPLHPLQWSLTYNGDTISLYPSIGNWSFPCRSHYWIRNSTIHTARTFNDNEINDLRAHDHQQVTTHYNTLNAAENDSVATKKSMLSKVVSWINKILRLSG